MPQIVAATDFSMRSHRALRRAGLLARQCAAELILVHIVDDDQPENLVDIEVREGNLFLKEQMASLPELRDVRCRSVVETGEAFEGILRMAREVSADLIVMGTHRKQVLRDVFIGTTIERVIRTGSYPVLMVNTEAQRRYLHALAPVDMSEASAHAIKTAKMLQIVSQAQVTLLHAFLAPGKGKMYFANVPKERIDEYTADERSMVRDELFAFLAAHELGDSEWSHRIEEGGPLEVISRVVAETSPDLIVIGTHGRSALAKIFLGSVAEEVLRSLDVDILAVPLRR
jgi:nucleotide-binding universal stress UspA family protein